MYPVMKDRNGRRMASHTSVRSRCGAWGNAPWTSREAIIISWGFISSAVSWRKMASWGDLPAMAPHMLAGMWAKTASAMQPRMSVHTSLTSVVAQTMGCQFPGCAQSPFL